MKIMNSKYNHWLGVISGTIMFILFIIDDLGAGPLRFLFIALGLAGAIQSIYKLRNWDDQNN